LQFLALELLSLSGLFQYSRRKRRQLYTLHCIVTVKRRL